jgi:DNA polymerase-3 subunit delta'
MSWSDFKQNAVTVRFVEKAIRAGRLGHAYLITGESGQKLDLARQIAAALNCEKADGEACGVCPACKKIFSDRHPDIRIVRPESRSRRIKIDEVRELERVSFLKASEARQKVGIFIDADRLTLEAQDAFLKTLEEPPKNTRFLLITTEPQQLKHTILSRCLRINLFHEDPAEPSDRQKGIQAVLQNWKSESGQSALFQTYRLADAFQVALQQARAEAEAVVEAEYEGKGYENLDADRREKIEEEKKAAVEALYRREREQLIRVVQTHLRNLSVVAPEDAQLVSAFDAVEKMHARFNRNMNEGLVLEVTLMKLSEALEGAGKK